MAYARPYLAPDVPIAVQQPTTLFAPLSDAERADSLRRTLADGPDGPPWVFAYGALLWAPIFRYDQVVWGEVEGFGRSFCIWTVEARGTLEHPGLGLGLRPAKGGVRGRCYQLHPDALDAGLHRLWQREMYTGVYAPRWVTTKTATGNVTALTFVVDPAHPQFAGDVAADVAATLIRRATGQFGSCRDYLASTVAELARAGIDDQDLNDLLRRVDALNP